MGNKMKRRARGGGRGVRPGRGAAPRKLERIEHTAWQRLREPLERLAKGLYQPALPFEIHGIDNATPIAVREPLIDEPDEDWNLMRFEDPPRCWIDIANEALNSGLRLSFDVPRSLSCQLTALLVARLGADMHAAYDVVRKRLVLWHENEDELRTGGFERFSARLGKAVV